MTNIPLNAYKNAAGKWLQISETHSHTGAHQHIWFVDDINQASVLPYIPPQIKKNIDEELTAVQAVRTVTVTLVDATSSAAEPTQETIKSSVPVSFWEDYNEAPPVAHAFIMDVDDQRTTNGQMYVDIGSREGHLDDMICLTMEVNRLPSKADSDVNPEVPCVHMHFDGDNLAGSFFKVADKIIFRPETDVLVKQIVLDNDEVAYEISTMP